MPVKILLVDDQASRRLTYRAVLEPLGEELFEAASGEDALRLLMQHEFAVILLDVNMPGMDGFETASLIHQHPRFESTPIIFVTAVNVDDMDRLRGYKLGAVDYVMVPVIPEILRSKVMVLCELCRKRRELTRANQELANANEALRLEKARELETLNASLQQANAMLEQRNDALQAEVEERRRAEERLREADRRKDEFLAMLAHELRNPLAPMQNALAVRGLDPASAHDPLYAMMERQLRQLVRLIDDLMDMARVSQGKITLRRRDTRLADVIQAAVEMTQPSIDEQRQRLTVTLPPQEVRLHADPERLTQVFANLLNNAAKYSAPGDSIALQVMLEDGALEVAVHDQGMGLAQDETERIFELFAQLERGASKAGGGLGLGLTLVRELVAMHGGSVSAQSDGPGRGSVFRVRLPYAANMGDVCAPHDSAGSAAADAARARRKVLVVDDNRDAADSLAMMIRLLGHEAAAVYDPLQVAEIVRCDAPDLLFLDIGMPELDGRGLATQLRALPGGETLTLVAVSGWGQPADIEKSHAAGFDNHLVKPPRLDQIAHICAGGATARARV